LNLPGAVNPRLPAVRRNVRAHPCTLSSGRRQRYGADQSVRRRKSDAGERICRPVGFIL
jgi:hypothetical protein